MEEIQREKDASSLAAAVWPSFDDINEGEKEPSSVDRARDRGTLWDGRVANPLQQRTFGSASVGTHLTGCAGSAMYSAHSLSEQSEPMLGPSYSEEEF